MVDTFNKRTKTQYLKQESATAQARNLSFDAQTLEDRALVAKYITDIEVALMNEDILLFKESTQEDITPLNIAAFVATLIAQSQEIANMAITMAPVWTFDRIAAFFRDFEKLIVFGDTTFRQHFVFLLKLVTSAQERYDLVSISDLFAGECPSLLRSLLHQLGLPIPKETKSS